MEWRKRRLSEHFRRRSWSGASRIAAGNWGLGFARLEADFRVI
jgi:hypothetical protein